MSTVTIEVEIDEEDLQNIQYELTHNRVDTREAVRLRRADSRVADVSVPDDVELTEPEGQQVGVEEYIEYLVENISR